MTIIKVPDIHCQGCANTIEASLAKAGVKGSVDFRFKTVAIGNEADKAKAVKAIEDAGYTPAKD